MQSSAPDQAGVPPTAAWLLIALLASIAATGPAARSSLQPDRVPAAAAQASPLGEALQRAHLRACDSPDVSASVQGLDTDGTLAIASLSISTTFAAPTDPPPASESRRLLTIPPRASPLAAPAPPRCPPLPYS